MKTKKTIRPRHFKRKLHISGQVWTYRIGRHTIVIRYPDGIKTVRAECSDVTGLSPDIRDRGKWKGTSDAWVKPAQIKNWIKTNLVNLNG